MDDLTAFIKARLAEDEAAAKAADEGPWKAVPCVYGPPEDGYGEPHYYEIRSPLRGPHGDVVSHQTHEGGGVHGAANAVHIARHDPPRTLREVEALRRLVIIHNPGTDPCDPGNARLRAMPCEVLTFVAAIWSEHPDYRQEWAA